MNTNDITLSNFKLHCLVYGNAKTGKTRFASTFPRPYFFDFDHGMLSVRGTNIEYDHYPSIKGKDAIAEFENMLVKIQDRVDIDTVVIDSMTLMQERIMAYVLMKNNKPTASLSVKDAISQPIWGVLINYIEALLLAISRFEKHVVIIGHEEMIKDEITSEVKIQPLVYGKKLPGEIPMFFDEVYRTVIIQKGLEFQYRLQMKGDSKIQCGSRLGVFEQYELPTFQNIMEKVKGGKK